MPKRKRSSPSPSAPAPLASNATIAKRTKNCEKCIAEAQKAILKALRHGSMLERQKHSRRKKDATKKNDTKAIHRLDAEYQTLKALNLEQLGDQHLRKTLAKVKSLHDAEPLKEYIAGAREGTKDINTLNVTARLFKVTQVKKVVDGFVADLKNILGAAKGKDEGKEAKVNGGEGAKDKKAAKDEDVDMKDASDEDDPYMAFSARIAAPSSGEDDSEASVTDDERPPSIVDSESEHDPDDDLDAESESESDDEGENEELANNAAEKLSRSIAPPSDENSEDSEAESESDSEAAVPTKKAKPKAIEDKPTTSAFIPALSHAAYLPGSESEASDLDVDTAPRKNRRGQRARQKIAELKYGQKAKHLEKQRGATFDPKRGAVSGTDKRQRRGKPLGRGLQQSGGNAEPLGERGDKKDRKIGEGKKRDDKGELHPSWQAAKKAKESKKIKIDLSGTKPAGKKVVFD